MGKRSIPKNKDIRKVKQLTEEKEDITKEILLGILKTGAVLGLAIFAPGVLRVFKDYGRDEYWREYYPSSIEKVTKRLYRRGYVEVVYEKGKPAVKITDKGKVEILRYDLEKLQINKPPKWDGKWRLVIFDIPEKYRNSRDLIRSKLKQLGFYQFQKSVFIYPYPCEKEIKFLREVLGVPHAIKLIKADKVENDEELRKIFSLN